MSRAVETALHRYVAQAKALLRAMPSLIARSGTRVGNLPRVRFVYEQQGAPMRYRVLHQIEQAALREFAVDAVSIHDTSRLYDLAACDLLYLYRLPLTSRTWPLCVLACWLRIPIVFDSDDLVWDERERQFNYLDAHYSAAMVQTLVQKARRIRALMQRADVFVFSTPYLAHYAAQTMRQPAYVQPNALSAAMVDASEQALALRQPHDFAVVIGYFCGTPHVHDEDVASIAPALATVLALCPQARLRIYGELTLPAPLTRPAFSERIEHRQAVAWDALPYAIAEVDINIAPLVDNPQRRAKSAVKYLEAALVAVPTVAARLDPYAPWITDGVTGMLAWTQAEWARSLLALVQSPDMRHQIGQAARAHALATQTTAVRAPHFAAILTQIIEHYRG